MYEYGLPALFAVGIWWFSTGAILFLVGLPRRTYRACLAVASVLSAASLYGLAATAHDPSVTGAYLAFGCGILVWGWHEIAFLTGAVTGPNIKPALQETTGWRRFCNALLAILYHELAILATAGMVLALTWGGINQVGAWTFMILWLMRLSAKLNLFFGVPNVPDEFLPAHLAYLKSHFRRRPTNLFLPFSLGVSAVITALLVANILAPAASGFEAVSGTLLATLLVLAVLEHCFFVIPVPVAEIWSWGLRSRNGAIQKSLPVADPAKRARTTLS